MKTGNSQPVSPVPQYIFPNENKSIS